MGGLLDGLDDKSYPPFFLPQMPEVPWNAAGQSPSYPARL